MVELKKIVVEKLVCVPAGRGSGSKQLGIGQGHSKVCVRLPRHEPDFVIKRKPGQRKAAATTGEVYSLEANIPMLDCP